MKAKWVVVFKGGPEQKAFEIAVIRDDNEHGKRSYGWFDENKLLVTHNGGPCSWPVVKIIWDRLIIIAQQVADDLNDAEKLV